MDDFYFGELSLYLDIDGLVVFEGFEHDVFREADFPGVVEGQDFLVELGAFFLF